MQCLTVSSGPWCILHVTLWIQTSSATLRNKTQYFPFHAIMHHTLCLPPFWSSLLTTWCGQFIVIHKETIILDKHLQWVTLNKNTFDKNGINVGRLLPLHRMVVASQLQIQSLYSSSYMTAVSTDATLASHTDTHETNIVLHPSLACFISTYLHYAVKFPSKWHFNIMEQLVNSQWPTHLLIATNYFASAKCQMAMAVRLLNCGLKGLK